MLLACALASCGEQGGGEFSFWQTKRTGANATLRVEVKTTGLVIDAANVLEPGEEQRIGRLAEKAGETSRRKVLVLTVPPLAGQSLEQFGWAINGQRKDEGTVLLMVRPDDRMVRVESGGALTPVQAARVAAAMGPQLAAKRPAAAIETGLGVYASLWGAD
nr:TPM domain-containing protein [Sphingomonas kaistensis]